MKTSSRWLAVLLALCMCVSLFPLGAIAANAPTITVDDEGCYSQVVSKKDYAISPGVSESTIVYNDASGMNQNIGYVMQVDTTNEYAGFVASYKDMGTGVKNGVFGTQVMSQQAAYAESMGFNVVGGINTSLRWGSEEPMGMLVINGEVLHNELSDYNYFVVTADGKADIRDGSVPLDGTEQQAVACFPHWLVKDGQNMNAEDHAQGNRAPRTAIGIREDGSVVLFVCDGRNVPTAMGMTLYETAEALIQLGCVKATNCDGGGSSTFLSEREGTGQLTMKNTPSDASERATLGGLLVISNAQPSGTFDHAAITPADNYYTPGSTVAMAATAVDYSGAAAGAMPEDVVWALADESMGSIANARFEDGQAKADFVSSGTAGTVNVELKQGDKVVGSTSFFVQAPDSLAFNSDSINLTYEQVTDLGLVAKYQGNTLTMNGQDIRWTITDETVGTFDGLYLTTTSDVLKSASATVTATYVGNEALTASTTVNIGMKPSVVMDGGDGSEIDPLDYSKGFGRVVARVSRPYGIGFWERGTSDTVDLITAHYTNNEGNCADASLWRGGNESAEYVTTDMPEWTDIIRFGNGAVKLNYDFSQANGIEGACLGFSHDIELTGSPTGIGMWVYAPEGTANLWLRGAIGVETAPGSGEFDYNFINYTERADAAWNASDGKDVGGINWTGWHYVEADLRQYAGRTIRVMAGETVRLMYTNGKYGPTVNGVVTGMGNLSADATYIPREECKGWVLIDNLQFVYGANNEDVTEPTVSGVQYSTSKNDLNRIELKNGDELKVTGRPCFWFDYNDNEYTDKYATGVSTKLFYFDGMLNGGGYSVDAEGYVFMEKYLSNGPHTLTCYVKDEAGNITRETRSFTITGADATYKSYPTMSVEHSDELYLGDELTLSYKTDYEDLSNVSSVEATINMNRNYPVKDVVFSDDFTGSYTYNAGVLKVTGHVKDGVTTASDDTFFQVIVSVPTTLTEGSNFNFEVAAAYLTLKTDQLTDKNVLTWSMALPTVYLPIQAKYAVKADTIIAGHESTVYVTDVKGKGVADAEVYADDQLIGTTDSKGVLKTNAFAQGGRWSVYAKGTDGAVSFPVTLRSSAATGEQTPYYILSNAVSDPGTEKNLTWMSNPDYAAAAAQVKYSTAADMSNAAVAEGTVKALSYSISDVANYSNHVVLTGLTPATTYYYQVGDGTVWSDVRSFTTAAKKDTVTNFFVIGDMQGEDAVVARQYSDLMKAQGTEYDFGVQLGDAIDNPDKYNEWQGSLGVFSDGIFAETDIVHVIGNHETFASTENTAKNARAIFGVPADDASGYYSFEYGNVYVAVIGYTLDQSIQQASMDWLLQDAKASDCPWKVLVLHVPVYYSNSEQSDSAFYVEHLPAVAEAAGITAVFSGHDHSYARTAELNGVTYVIAGTAGEKKYACTTNGFDFVETHGDGEPIATPTQNYGALYLSLSATAKRMTLTTYNVDENGVQTVFDRTEWGVPVCTDHEFVHDRSTDVLTCSVCGAEQGAAETRYSGLAVDEATGRTVYFANGALQTGDFKLNNTFRYFDADALGYEGDVQVCGETCQFEGGVYVSSSNPNVVAAGFSGTNVQWVLYRNGTMKLEGAGATRDYTSSAQVPWYNYRSQIKTVEIDADITSLGRRTFYYMNALENVKFASGSKLTTIGSYCFGHCGKLKDIVLPDGVTAINTRAFEYDTALQSVYIPDDMSIMHKEAFYQCSNVVLNVPAGGYSEDYAKTYNIDYITRGPAAIAEGTCGENLTWTLDSSGTLRIEGEGPMDNFSACSAPWYANRNQIFRIEIGKDVTTIGSRAFHYLGKAETISFDEGSKLNSIGSYAFSNAKSLKSVTLPDGVTKLGTRAFEYCPALTYVYIPDQMSSMHKEAFYQDANVVLSVPAGGYSEDFAKTNNVAYTTRGPETIAEGTCGENLNWTLDSAGTLRIEGSGAMTDFAAKGAPWYEYRTQIFRAEFGKGVTTIGSRAFYYCGKLESVSFDEGSELNSVGSYAFSNAKSLKSITLPDGVTKLGTRAFESCTALTDVYIPDAMSSMHKEAFYRDANVVLSVPAGGYSEDFAKTYNVAYTTRGPAVIAEGTCGANLTWKLDSAGSLQIDGIGAMTNYAAQGTPWYAYRTQIFRAEIGASVTTIGSRAFYYCSKLQEVSFAEGSKLVQVESYAFSNAKSLQSIALPDGVTKISTRAFESCTALTSAVLPQSLSSIHKEAFYRDANVILQVVSGSYAETFAQNNGVPYTVI